MQETKFYQNFNKLIKHIQQKKSFCIINLKSLNITHSFCKKEKKLID